MRNISIGTYISSPFNLVALLFKLSFLGDNEMETLFSSDLHEKATSIVNLAIKLSAFSESLRKCINDCYS